MNGQTAVVIGATGLVGSALVQQLLNDDAFDRVRILVRRTVNLKHPKLETCITDFSNYEQYKQQLGNGDCIFCCIGTTMTQVKGDKAVYRSIDFDIPVNAARFGKEAGFQQYLLVSAIGANCRSRFFYTRLKGEVEETIASFKLSSLHVFRPSFLLGKRTENRSGEQIGIFIFRLLNPILPSKYKGITAETVAQSMIAAAKLNKQVANIYCYNEMIYLSIPR